MYRKKTFMTTCGAEKLSAYVLTGDSVSLPNVLLLHGAGGANKERMHYLAEFFVDHGRTVLSFDFSGHGESTGELSASSLEKRVAEAAHMLQFCDTTKPLIIVGSSMGGEVAVRLSQKCHAASLVLFCPAFYDDVAYSIPFTHEFSTAIRQEGSWRKSIARTILEKYRGDIVVVIGDEDAVIPPGCIDAIDVVTRQVKSKEIIRIAGAGHAIHARLREHPGDREGVLGVIEDIVG